MRCPLVVSLARLLRSETHFATQLHSGFGEQNGHSSDCKVLIDRLMCSAQLFCDYLVSVDLQAHVRSRVPEEISSEL